MKKLLLLFCLVGCSGFETRVRSPKNLDTMNGILYSNTQNNPYKVKVDKKTLYLNYDLILKNTSATVRNFNLGDSKLLFNDIKKDSIKEDPLKTIAKATDNITHALIKSFISLLEKLNPLFIIVRTKQFSRGYQQIVCVFLIHLTLPLSFL